MKIAAVLIARHILPVVVSGCSLLSFFGSRHRNFTLYGIPLPSFVQCARDIG